MTVLAFSSTEYTLVRRLVTVVSAFGISTQYLPAWSTCPDVLPPRKARPVQHQFRLGRRYLSSQAQEPIPVDSRRQASEDEEILADDRPDSQQQSDKDVVLCHALYGFDGRGPSSFPTLQMHYWSNLLDILRHKVTADVVVTSISPTGSVTERAPRKGRPVQQRLSLGRRHLSTQAQEPIPVDSRRQASEDAEIPADDRPDSQKQSDKEPQDIIHQLLRYPALYDPLRAPRNPVVLCHGLYGFDVRGPSSFPTLQMHYWSNVLNILRHKVGADVIVTSVSPTGSVTERAENLDRLLQKQVQGKEVNFMAHSMGGLDCRHLITHIKPSTYTPVSLMSISTPHRGSPFMDWCAENIGLGKLKKMSHPPSDTAPPPTAAELASETKASTDSRKGSPQPGKTAVSAITSFPSSFTTYLLALFDSPAYANLTTDFLQNHFNPATPDDPRVKYLSVAARAPSVNVFHPFWFTKMVLDAWERKERERLRTAHEERLERLRREGRWSEIWGIGRQWWEDDDAWGNDGLVSVQSAKWGEFLGVIEGADHWEIRGARGLELDDVGLGRLGSLDIGEWEWPRLFGSKKDGEGKEGKGKKVQVTERTTATTVEQTAEEKERDDILKSSAQKLSAVFDWIIDHVPVEAIAKKVPIEQYASLESFKKLQLGDLKLAYISELPSAAAASLMKSGNKEGTSRRGEKNELATKQDLERFYVALARKLYDEGL